MMMRIWNSLICLFWWLVLHVLIVINFIRFCAIFLLSDLSPKVVPLPGPATTVQTLESDLAGDQMGEIGPKDSGVAPGLLPCDPLPCHSSTMENHSNPQTQHEPPRLPPTPADATSDPPIVQQHTTQPLTHTTNAQAHRSNASSRHSEREDYHADASLRSPLAEIQADSNPSQDAIPYQLPFFGNGSPMDELRSVIPCWDFDHVIGEGSTCTMPSNRPSSVGTDVALKVVQRAEEMATMFIANDNQHLLQRALHFLNHIIPLLRDHTLLAPSLDLQATCSYMLFKETRNISLLDQSIDTCQRLQGRGMASRETTLLLCGMASAERYDIRGDSEDLDRGIKLLREALEGLAGTGGRDPEVVARLGTLLLRRYGRKRDRGDLNNGIDLLGEALSLLNGNDPGRLGTLIDLGKALVIRYEQSKKISDVEEAIVCFREALPYRSGDHPDRSLIPSRLAVILIARYNRLGNILDLEEAIAFFRETLSSLSSDDPDLPRTLTNLAGALITRYEESGSISDLEEAIIRLCEALSHQPGTHPGRPTTLSNLGAALIIRYKRLGNIPDVEKAIAHHREAISLLSTNDPDRSIDLGNLGTALIMRYKKLGRISDLEEAIVRFREALSHWSGNHPEQPSCLNNLGSVLTTRYDTLGNISDLVEAIDSFEKACNTSDPGDPKQSTYNYNLASLLLKRMDNGDEDKAIGLYKKALTLQPENHPDRPGTLYHLGMALLERKPPDTEPGMRYIDNALSLFPGHSPDRQKALLSFLAQFSQKADKTVLRDRCIDVPPEDASYSLMTSLVAPFLYGFYDTASELLAVLGIDPSLNTEDATLALLQKGSLSTTSPSRDQLRCTCQWIIRSKQFDRPCGLEMYNLLLEHLNLAVTCGTSLDVRRQQLSNDFVLQRARDLVSDGVASAIEQEEIETAVGFLERGRSILLAQLSSYRVSSGLEAVAPDIATRFDNLSLQVESATFTEGKRLVDTAAKHPFEGPISRASRLTREWQVVVEEIRSLDGFQQFLRPTPFADLKKAAGGGPVILINTNESRSDAIIITFQDSPTVVPLPHATPSRIDTLVGLFKAAVSNIGNDVYGPLRSLWEGIVKPIVVVLDEKLGVPRQSRIWWCTAGAVARLPLHAAGDYYVTNDGRLPDLYVSSYTPTLGALSCARQHRLEHSDISRLLLVGQSDTPNLSLLPSVPDEIARVKKRIPCSTVIEGEDGARDTVLSLVTQHRWIHLSCHGKVNPKNPLRSHFALHDGPLSLHELMQNRLPYAELAFLSCCHSASGNSSIPDEFLHLAAGMQFAGFKSVVGTMWAMNDARTTPFRLRAPKRRTAWLAPPSPPQQPFSISNNASTSSSYIMLRLVMTHSASQAWNNQLSAGGPD